MKMARITDEQQKELDEILKTDILERYNNSQYWKEYIIEEFYVDNDIDFE